MQSINKKDVAVILIEIAGLSACLTMFIPLGRYLMLQVVHVKRAEAS